MLDKKKIYQLGSAHVKHDLSIFNILQTIKKLKATVSVLVSDKRIYQRDMVDKIQKAYFYDSIIHLDP
jgi:hypothetical protein